MSEQELVLSDTSINIGGEVEEILDGIDPRDAKSYKDVFGNQQDCIVKQLVEVLEVVLGFETENKYQAFLRNGCELSIFEESTFFSRWFCGNKRALKLHVVCNQEEILMFQRSFYLFNSVLKVFDYKENKQIGKVVQKGGCCCCKKQLDVYIDGKKEYKIVAPCLSFWLFHIRDPKDNKRLGLINKKWSGLFKEWVTDADNFGVWFPKKADAKHKAVLFAATFLIDYLYFETNANEQ